MARAAGRSETASACRGSLASAVSFLKQRETLLDPARVDGVFASHGHRWRDRDLPPAETMELFVRQIVAGNAPCAEVRAWRDGAFTAPAYCQARLRLPLPAVRELTQSAITLMQDAARSERAARSGGGGRWRDHRTFHVDGTGFSMPDTPELQDAFGQPGMQKKGCGFPVAHLLVLFDADTGIALEAHPAPLRTHDLKHIQTIHAHLAETDVLIGDKAFGSWAHLALLQAKGMHGVFPLHQRRKVTGGHRFDRIETWARPKACPAWADREAYEALPEGVRVRVIRRPVSRGPGRRSLSVTLVTTLLDAEAYPADEIVTLAAGRWNAETNLRHLKTTLKLDVLRCQSLPGVLRELAVILLVYNLVRATMLKAGARQGVPASRISFADALRFIRWSSVDADLYDLIVNPDRPGRIEPRAVKRRNDKFVRMTQPRDVLRKRLETQAKAV